MINPENVLSNPLAFKAKLAIGEDAYTSLKYVKDLPGLLGALGIGGSAAGVASSSAVAGVIGTKVGLLSFIGIGTFITPLPYVALAGVGAFSTSVGIMRLLRSYSKERVDVVPKFINTPLDVLAIALFDLLAPLALKVAVADGEKSSSEHELIIEHFSNDWGYSRDYIEQSIGVIEEQIRDLEVEQLLNSVSAFIKKNPDCNQIEIAKSIKDFLREIAEVDGILAEDEARLLKVSEDHFNNDANSFVKKLTMPINVLTNIIIQSMVLFGKFIVRFGKFIVRFGKFIVRFGKFIQG